MITQQTRLVGDALNGVNNGWKEAVQQLVSPSPRADTMSSDQVKFIINQFQQIPHIHQSVHDDDDDDDNKIIMLIFCSSFQPYFIVLELQ